MSIDPPFRHMAPLKTNSGSGVWCPLDHDQRQTRAITGTSNIFYLEEWESAVAETPQPITIPS